MKEKAVASSATYRCYKTTISAEASAKAFIRLATFSSHAAPRLSQRDGGDQAKMELNRIAPNFLHLKQWSDFYT